MSSPLHWMLLWMCMGWVASLVPLSTGKSSCSSVADCPPPASGGAVIGYWPFDSVDATLNLNISRSVTSVLLPSTTASVCSVQPKNTRTPLCSSYSTSLQPMFTSGSTVSKLSVPMDGRVAGTFAEIQGDVFNIDRLSMSIWMATTNTSDASIEGVNAILFAGQCTLLTSSAGEVAAIPRRSSCMQWWIVEGRLILVLPTLDAASSQTWVVMSSTAPLDWKDSEWHHLSVVCSALLTADDGACQLYHNGRPLSSSQQRVGWVATADSTLENINNATLPLPVVTINSSSPLSTDCRGVLALLDVTTAMQAVANGSYSTTQHGGGVNMMLSWNDGTTLNISSSCSVPQQYVLAAAWSSKNGASTTMATVWLDELWVVNFALTPQHHQSLIQDGALVSRRTANYYSFDHGILSRRGEGHSPFVLVSDDDTVDATAVSVSAVVRQGLALPLSAHAHTNTSNVFHHPRWNMSYSWSVAAYVGINLESGTGEATPVWSFVTPNSTWSHHLSLCSGEAGSTPSLFISYGTLNQTLPITGLALRLANESIDGVQWYHVAVTFDVEFNMLSVYINGKVSWSTVTTGVLNVHHGGHRTATVALGNNPYSPHHQNETAARGARRLLQTPGEGSVFVDQFQWGNTVLSVEEIEYMSAPTNTVCQSTPQASGCLVYHLAFDGSFTESYYNDAVTTASYTTLSSNGVFGGAAAIGDPNGQWAMTMTPNSAYQRGVFKSFQNDASVAFWHLTNAVSRPSPYWVMYSETDPNGNPVVEVHWHFDRIYLITSTASNIPGTNNSYVTYNDTRLWSSNDWHHILVVYSWNENTLSLYVDKIPVVIMTIVNPQRYASTTVFQQQWTGWSTRLDEVYAFNLAVTQDMEVALSEINTIFVTPQTCPVGTYYVEAYNTVQQQETRYCYNCSFGSTFNASVGTCDVCAVGSAISFNISTNAASCDPCVAGTFSNATSSHQCSICSSGSWSPTGSTVCTLCPRGTSNALEGQGNATACKLCDAGTASGVAGASACSACSAGYVSGQGATQCSACPANTMRTNENTCTACNFGQWAPPASNSCMSCSSNPCSPGPNCPCS